MRMPNNPSTSDTHALRNVACQRCSRRKQRCDRVFPVCSQCAAVDAECRSGRNEAFMTRTSVGSVQTKSQVELLETRLEELEALSREHGINVDSQSRAVPNSYPQSQGLSAEEHEMSEPGGGLRLVDPRLQSSRGRTRSQGPAHSVNGDHADNNYTQPDSERQSNRTSERQSRRHSPDIGLLSLTAMAEPNSRATEFLKGISMPGIISAITESFGGNPEKTTRIDALWDGIARDIHRSTSQNPVRLHLSKDEALKYVDTYYDVVDWRFPHLPREDVMRGIAAITASYESEYIETLLHDPAKVFMAYMVIAITPLVSDKYPVAQASFISIHILSKALNILSKVFQLEDGVDIISCLRLLVIFSLHSSAAGSTWHLQGVTMKKCLALGFHRSVARSNKTFREEELEHRRWAFWSCYFLDRLISCALDRPFTISDANITIELPGTSLPFSSRLSPSQSRYTHLHQYTVLQSRITAEKRASQLIVHLSQLAHWEASAPMLAEPYPLEQEEHLQSLCNTLTLRAMIDQIIRFGPDPASSAASTILSLHEFGCCCKAVVSSMNRRSMQRRSTLSWITGYSTIRACLGLLYCLAITFSAGNGQDKLADAEIQEFQRGIEIALDVLSVVARQFPVMQEYHLLISNLRTAVLWRIDSRRHSLPNSQIKQELSFVGPDGIYALVKHILALEVISPRDEF